MKPSWTEVVALAILLGFGLVMAKGWPSGDWAFGWGAVGAIGSIVTGLFAVRISLTQQQWVEDEHEYRRGRAVREAVRAGVELHNLSRLASWLIESDQAVPPEIMAEIDTGFDAVYALRGSDDLYLLNSEWLNAFEKYHAFVSIKREQLGAIGLSPPGPRARAKFIENLKSISEESEKLVLRMGGDSNRLRKY